MSTNLILERASKNLQAMVASAAKAAADLGTLSAESIVQAEKIEDLKAEAAELAHANESARRAAAAELKLRVKEDADAVLNELLANGKLARISEADLANVRSELAARVAADDKELRAAVYTAVQAAQREAKAEALQVEATNKVASAEKDATIAQQKLQLDFMAQQNADLRKQIEDERAARIAIATAESNKQGVIVNTGK